MNKLFDKIAQEAVDYGYLLELSDIEKGASKYNFAMARSAMRAPVKKVPYTVAAKAKMKNPVQPGPTSILTKKPNNIASKPIPEKDMARVAPPKKTQTPPPAAAPAAPAAPAVPAKGKGVVNAVKERAVQVESGVTDFINNPKEVLAKNPNLGRNLAIGGAAAGGTGLGFLAGKAGQRE